MMRKILYIVYSAMALLLLIVGCENKWPDNGDLDGMWQLMSIEQNGQVVSLKETKYYWSIRTSLVQFTEYGNTNRKYAHFQRRDGKLILTDFCYNWGNTDEHSNNEWICSSPEEERDILIPWGLYPTPDPEHPERLAETFTIVHLDYDSMILSTSSYKLRFRKF